MAPSAEILAKTAKPSKSSDLSKAKREKTRKKRKSEAKEDVVMEEAPKSEGVEAAKPSISKKDRVGMSSKKRKAENLAEGGLEVTTKSVQEAEPAEVSEAEKFTNDDRDEPTSKKRKVVADEIEVDITLPEPPSKKELRRLKKGKTLPAKKSGAETSPEPEAKKPEVEKRSEHGIWIGNLPWHVSKADLRTFLVEQSDITEEMITRVHMPGPNDGKSANKVEAPKKFVKPVHNKGFAYVDFTTAEGVGYAIELSEQLLAGRRVLVKNHKSFEGRPLKTKEESRNDGKPPSKRVFLGNLSFDTTEESLKEHFEKCGAIASVKVATFEDTGKCKGYAWIVFEELESAEHAVRGFVRIEEEDPDQSESEDESGAESGAEEVVKLKSTNTKTRKWWVNKIKGRPLRMEFAEDAQVRYKKRYGKDGTKNEQKGSGANGEAEEIKERVPKEAKPKVIEYDRPYAHKLTGGIVASEGKKVVF